MTKLFQKKASGKMWQWSVRVDGYHVITTYGYIDGKMQSTRETAHAVNVGKKNEVSPEEQARLIAERKIKEKLDNGYSKSTAEAEEQDLGAELDFDNMSTSFCPAKPISDLPDDTLSGLWEAGRAIVQRKFDGLCHFYVMGSDPKILSRGKLEDKTDHVPHIRDALAKLPTGTILNGEICLDPTLGDDFKHVTSTLRHKTPDKAVEKQKNGGLLHYIVFDVLYWGGEDVTGMKYVDRLKLFTRWAGRHARKNAGAFSTPLNLAEHKSFDALFGDNNLSVRHGWEGYVVWDALETTQIRWDGKTARKNCYKWKHVFTEDVWAEDPQAGKGRNEKRLGKVTGYQYIDGEKVCVGDIGGGFTDAEREQLWKDRETAFPCVIEVETPERQPSMKLRFPVFSRLRPDKQEHECTAELMPRNASRKDPQPSS